MTLDERKMFLSDRFYEMKAGEISEPEFLCNMEWLIQCGIENFDTQNHVRIFTA
jgi:hypothetical protein